MTPYARKARTRAAAVHAVVERLFAVAEEIRVIAEPLPGETLEQFELRLLREMAADIIATEEARSLTEKLKSRVAEMRRVAREIEHCQELGDFADRARREVDAVNSGLKAAGGRLDEAHKAGERAERMAANLAAAAKPGPSGPLASEMLAPYFVNREKVADATHQVMGQDRGTLNRFIEICGDRRVDGYCRGDINKFLKTMRRMPSVYGRSPKDAELSVEQLISRAEADENGSTLSEKTVKRHLSALTQFFKFAVDEGHLESPARASMLDEHRFRLSKTCGARGERDVWTVKELQTLLSGPVHAGENGLPPVRDAYFWLPLLALFHGSRLEEFADLRRKDIKLDGDVWAVTFSEWEDGDTGRRRRLKNTNATRTVAIHPEIIKIGFLEYIDEIAKTDLSPLFPDLEPQGADGKRGPRVTRWFVDYRKDLKIYRPGVAMHAFRHCAETRLRDAMQTRQHERHIDFMFGHSAGAGEGAERYDKGPGLAAAAETLAMLSYPELDTERLHVRMSVRRDR